MIHNSTRGCQHNIAKLSGRKKVVSPLLNVTALIQAPSKIDNNLSRSMVVNNLKLSNVTMLHHHCEKPDDNLRTRTDKHLTLASLFSIINAT